MSDLDAAKSASWSDGPDPRIVAFFDAVAKATSPAVAKVARDVWERVVAQNAGGPDRRRLLEFSRLLAGDLADEEQERTVKVLMDRWGVPFPTYNIDLPFDGNRQPWGAHLLERPTAGDRKWSVLGREVGVPLGVPASPLTLNSAWVDHHARNGFNVLTYKTVRPRARDPHQFPNWRFLSDAVHPFAPDGVAGVNRVVEADEWPRSMEQISSANSFGVPSKDPDEWIVDVRDALKFLAADQLLILSVMGGYEDRRDQDLVDDFVLVARHASRTGVTAVELNLSCPSGIDRDGHPLPPICDDPNMVLRIVEAVRPVLDSSIALIVKFSYLKAEAVGAALRPVAGVIDGVSGINTLQASITTNDGSDLFPGRSQGGLSGYLLKDLAVDFVRSVSTFRREAGESFDILGMGGVMVADDAFRLFETGADVVQAASGVCFNHRLAQDVAEQLHGDRATAQRSLAGL